MAYLNIMSTDFFAEDLNATPPRFKLYKNQGVANYVDYEVLGVFSGRGALRFESVYYPLTPQRIFRILTNLVFLPLQISNSALKLTPPDGWSGKEVRVKVLIRGENGIDADTFFDLGGDATNAVKFRIGRAINNMIVGVELWQGTTRGQITNTISFPTGTPGDWHLVDFQVKISSSDLNGKVDVYPVILNPDGTFNSLGTAIDVQTGSIPLSFIPSPNTLWGINPFEVQGYSGNPAGIWLDNLSIGQGEVITEL
jgi:hypothetical protein